MRRIIIYILLALIWTMCAMILSGCGPRVEAWPQGADGWGNMYRPLDPNADLRRDWEPPEWWDEYLRGRVWPKPPPVYVPPYERLFKARWLVLVPPLLG